MRILKSQNAVFGQKHGFAKFSIIKIFKGIGKTVSFYEES